MANWREKQNFDTSGGMKPGVKYKDWQVEKFADDILIADTRRELCRICSEYGIETGTIEPSPQFDEETNEPVLDEEGDQLVINYIELQCEGDHRWYQGEGERRGIGGKDPILFESHIADRKRREIMVASGIPDPGLVSGLYNRAHPQGRRVNTPEHRKATGSSFYV